MTMDSPWVEREIWPFLKVPISPKLERLHPSNLMCMHLTSIPTFMIFLGQFRLIKFFDDHGQSMGRKGNLAVFESTNISETGETTPIKFDVHAFDINPYLHDFFVPILID